MWPRTSRVVYIDVRWLLLKIMAIIIALTAVITYWNWTRITVIEFSSDDLEAHWRMTDTEIIKQITSGLKNCTNKAGVKAPAKGIEIRLFSKMEIREYLWDGTCFLMDKKTGEILVPDNVLKKHFELAARELKKRSPFGELINWKEVKGIFRIGSQAVVVDIDTGKKFNVRRTGGYSHADIEPLTVEDTTRLREIYDGKNSWKRRAVVVQTSGRKISASLTGASHGRGQVNDNGLPGKVGLYFWDGEKNSGSGLSHRMMVLKASGRTRLYLREMTPEAVVIAIFTAIDQQDIKTLKFMLNRPGELTNNILEDVIGVTVTQVKKKTNLVYDVTVSVSMKKGPYNQKRYIRLDLNKDLTTGCYLAENRFLKKLLER